MAVPFVESDHQAGGDGGSAMAQSAKQKKDTIHPSINE
jgi:hypothetical protein